MTEPDTLAEELAELAKISEEEAQRLISQVDAKSKV